jgi:hypothetical protein
MGDVFRMSLAEMQPSQLFISTEKLAEVLRGFDPSRMEPIPVKRLGDDVVMTDGHTRGFAALLCGMRELPVVWDEDELDWEAYEICVAWCKADGIRSVADLVGRVIGAAEYEERWLGRCRAMHRELEQKRRGAAN